MTTVIILSLLGMVVAIAVGSFWYSPLTPMGRLHMRYLGVDKLSPEEQQNMMAAAKPTMWKSYLGQAILSLLTSFATVFIITMSVQNGVSFWLALGFVVMNWLAFMVPVIGSSVIWGNTERAIAWPRFFSEISANLVTLLLIVFLASFFV